MINSRNLWPTPETQRLHWGWLAGKLSGNSELARPVLMCLRGVLPGADETHDIVADHRYRDTGVLVYRGGEVVFPMSSVPYQTNSKASPDVNGDGVGDVACVKPGHYVLVDKGAQPYPIFEVEMPDGSKRIPCSRDLKHSGDLSGPAIYLADAILLHTGLDGLSLSPASSHTSSIGCSTASFPWLQLIRDRAKVTGSGRLDYVIALADEVAEIMKTCPFLRAAPENLA